jgi:hypothetical protein
MHFSNIRFVDFERKVTKLRMKEKIIMLKKLKKRTVVQFAALLLLAAFAIAVGACPTEEVPVGLNKTPLQTKITEAKSARTGVVVNTSNALVASGTKWVTQAVQDTFDTAITVAETALSAATQTELDTAVTVLSAAITAYTNAQGTGTRTGGWTSAQLSTLIAEAIAAKDGVETDTHAGNVHIGKSWVTSEIMTALDNAITAAQSAVTANTGIDDAYSALSAALTAFTPTPGTKPIVTILRELIDEAKAAKDGVDVDTAAGNVAQGAKWVTSEEMTAFDDAISAAETALNATTQPEVDDAVIDLTAALEDFNDAKRDGTKTEGFQKSELEALILKAKADKEGVLTDTDADNVAGGVHWVTSAEMTALDTAITTAESAVSSNSGIDSAYTGLSGAITSFLAARKTGTTVTLTALNTLITQARTAKTGVLIDTAAGNVAQGTNWVLQSVMTTFDTAITTAEGALSATTQAEVTTAVTNLTSAISTFNGSLQIGTKISYDELNGLITAAKAARTGVEINTSAANVDLGTKWVTQAVMTAFDTAITTAEAAQSAVTQVAVNTAVTNLTTAITTFTNAQQQGTKTAPVGPVATNYGTTLTWGTEFTPTALGLTPGDDTTKLMLNWYSTQNSTGKLAQVRFIEGTKNAGYALIEATGAVANAVSSSTTTTHKVTVTGLKPDTSYQYSVRQSSTGENWSPMYDFKTPPATGTWTFAVISDPQLTQLNVDTDSRYPATNTTTRAGWAETMTKVVAANVSFIVSAGDQVDASSGNETEYNNFFAPPGLRSLPLAPTAGNHDRHNHFMDHYNLPNEQFSGSARTTNTMGTYFYLYNNILFVALNDSEGSQSSIPSGIAAYITRFENAINAAKTAHAGEYDWLIVQHHKSTASVADHCADQDIEAYVKAGFEKKMSELGVDFVLAGHDHVYARSYPLQGMDNGLVSLPDKTQSGQDSSNASINHVPGKPVYLTFTTGSGLKYYAVSADPYFKYNNTLYQKSSSTYPYLGANASGTATEAGSTKYMAGALPVSNAAFVQPYIPSYSIVTVSNSPTGARTITFKTYPITTKSGQNSGAQQAYSFNENTPYDTIMVTKPAR